MTGLQPCDVRNIHDDCFPAAAEAAENTKAILLNHARQPDTSPLVNQ